MTQRSGIGAVWANEKSRRRHLRRAQEPLRLRQHRRAHHPRRLAQRPPDGHAPAGRAAAPDRSEGRGHQPDRSHRRGQERRGGVHPELSRRGARAEVDPPGRLRVVVRGLLPARPRQPATAAGVEGHASRSPARDWSGSRRRASTTPTPSSRPATRRAPTASSSSPRRAVAWTPSCSSSTAPGRRRRSGSISSPPSRPDRRRATCGPTKRCRKPTSSCASTASIDGAIEHPFQVGPHTDRIALQVIDPAAPLDQSFEYTDLTAGGAGRLLLRPRHPARRQPGVLEPVLGGRLRPPAGDALADHRPVRRKREIEGSGLIEEE